MRRKPLGNSRRLIYVTQRGGAVLSQIVIVFSVF
jgi:hypothetical protein